MDTVLIVGKTDDKLLAFFQKVGYKVYHDTDSGGILQIIEKEVIDLVLIDSNEYKIAHDYIEFFRKNDQTRDTPIIVLSPDKLQTQQVKNLHFEKVDCIQAPYSLGTVISRVATQLRIRKMMGKDDGKASLSEVNAALRDLNERYAKELEEAQAIQQSLLPKELPKGTNFEVAAMYLPLDGVGGDWYHIGHTPTGKILILMADVTGHGLPAAFIGSMTKLAMTAAKKEAPAELLKDMNSLMSSVIPQGRFVTGNALLFDPETGKVLSARAGGPSAMHHSRATSVCNEIKGEGFPLGFFDDSEYTTDEFQMEKGDLLVVVTDGITEGQNRKKEFFGSNGIRLSLAKSQGADSAETALKTLHNDFVTFMDGRILKDDVTMIALKRL